MLPQSLIRFGGIEGIEDINFCQVEIPLRKPNDIYYRNEIYEVNKRIVKTINGGRVNFIKANEFNPSSREHCLLDCNILNLSHHFPKFRITSRYTVVDYSSLGHRSLALSDLRFVRESLRAIKRNLLFKIKHNPKHIYHWDEYASRNNNLVTDILWENSFVDTNKVAKISKNFIMQNLEELVEIRELDFNAKIIIIAPHIESSSRDLVQIVEKFLSENPKKKEEFVNADKIFIKQHRISTIKMQQSLNICGRNVILIESNILRHLPLEVLILSYPKSVFISAPTSSNFSLGQIDGMMLHKLTYADKHEYGLMFRRWGHEIGR